MGEENQFREVPVTEARPPLEVRHRHYRYDESIPKYFDSGNVLLTHEWNALNLMIPGGERYFIRSVQRLASEAKDPGLKLQIKGFIGQETMHYKETDRCLKLLENAGFPVGEYQAWQDRLLRRLERLSLPTQNLAGTAGAEHYTAVQALWHLQNHYCDKFPPAMRDITQWHGAEELEHKSVAFDLLQEVAPCNYFVRALGFVSAMIVNWISYRKALRMLLKWEGLSRAQIREERKRARKTRIPIFSLRIPRLLDYLRPGFHPDDLNDGGLGKKILAEQAAKTSA
jgi:uncharacterized protein